MPVTAKLSSKFYERFGDDIADELVDWFNAVDLTYQTQLRETNELHLAAIRSSPGFATIRAASRPHEVMFLYWVGSVFTLGGLLLGFCRPHISSTKATD